MKLYVCYTTKKIGSFHACGIAYSALKDAGYDPEVVYAYGWRHLPEFLNRTNGRREAKELTGNITVPVLLTDEGEAIGETRRIVKWAKQNPAT